MNAVDFLPRCIRQRRGGMIESLQGQMADLLIKKRIDEELGSRTDCTAVLAELCRVTPPDTALTRLDLKTVEIQAKEPDRPAGAPAAARAVAASPRDADRQTPRGARG